MVLEIQKFCLFFFSKQYVYRAVKVFRQQKIKINFVFFVPVFNYFFRVRTNNRELHRRVRPIPMSRGPRRRQTSRVPVRRVIPRSSPANESTHGTFAEKSRRACCAENRLRAVREQSIKRVIRG